MKTGEDGMKMDFVDVVAMRYRAGLAKMDGDLLVDNVMAIRRSSLFNCNACGHVERGCI